MDNSLKNILFMVAGGAITYYAVRLYDKKEEEKLTNPDSLEAAAQDRYDALRQAELEEQLGYGLDNDPSERFMNVPNRYRSGY